MDQRRESVFTSTEIPSCCLLAGMKIWMKQGKDLLVWAEKGCLQFWPSSYVKNLNTSNAACCSCCGTFFGSIYIAAVVEGKGCFLTRSVCCSSPALQHWQNKNKTSRTLHFYENVAHFNEILSAHASEHPWLQQHLQPRDGHSPAFTSRMPQLHSHALARLACDTSKNHLVSHDASALSGNEGGWRSRAAVRLLRGEKKKKWGGGNKRALRKSTRISKDTYHPADQSGWRTCLMGKPRCFFKALSPGAAVATARAAVEILIRPPVT